MEGQLAKRSKGQAATEMLATIGLFLVIMIPIVLLILVSAQIKFESLSSVQGESATRIIADSINQVWIEGPYANKVAIVNLPSNTESLVFRENEVVMYLRSRAGTTQVSYTFFGELEDDPATGIGLNISERQGLVPLHFHTNLNGGVVISYE